MAGRFDAFVILAEMRTGSNHLEAMLAAVPGLAPQGELFNPGFIGQHDRFEYLGFDLARREADPGALWDAVLSQSDGIPGQRFFHDHDPRMLDRLLPDPRVAKVILRRNPLDSYISRKIATETGQWKLTDAKHRKTARVAFDPAEFEEMLAARAAFAARIRRALQETGQTAFEIGYEDLSEPAVLTGLLRFLGIEGGIAPSASKLKPQNPGKAEDKVTNPKAMAAALARLDPFGLDIEPTGPARPPGVRSFVALPKAGLIYMPVPGAMVEEMTGWLAAVEGCAPEALDRDLTQKDLRQWMRARPGHRKISLVRHPLARAHHVFFRDVLPPGRPRLAELRNAMARRYDVPLPEDGPGPDWDAARHRAAFVGFLKVLPQILAGQTSLTAPGDWHPQMAILQGMAAFALPDIVLRAQSLADDLPGLLPGQTLPPAPEPPEDGPVPLAAIYDAEVEAAGFAACRRDYIFFGYGDWAG
ncbi:nodulation protein NodH [Rhodobacterales bacterium HKCCE3408]|nr:nodulation protein NodH [Rhodobacterales bacterium HKCCE3408]